MKLAGSIQLTVLVIKPLIPTFGKQFSTLAKTYNLPDYQDMRYMLYLSSIA